ncbi:translocation protein TolB [Sporocytophaga myxococcoides]|uniref:Translocation protein TolB n=1 Tax=Sporocytophaga myxococcoides TaxID=153721 RepID=A0A098L9D0_9BACT|nr:hypothetical protein [Sporocytophaga myxococcoides]GAL83516.1 translocation protein TolB [Sporocytophaga myxococcoides]
MRKNNAFQRIVILLFFFFIIIFNTAYSQYVETGQDPSRLRWKQIVTKNFQIIYPVEIEEEAIRASRSLEKVYLYVSYSLHHEPKKISVILHPQSSVSNAFVVWAPKRVEFYTIPDQDIYPQNWIDQLVIHEFRHVVQLDKLNQGLTKILYFLLGQQAIGAVAGLYLPLWFLEGDAVVTETALSHTGRGRLPEFTMPLRTQVLQRKIYSYEKAYFGSFRDFVPNYYYLGYQLVGYTRNRYPSEVWSKSVDNAARRPYNPMPFNQGIKRSTGLSKWKLYDSCMYFLRNDWRLQQDSTTFSTRVDTIHFNDTKTFTSYRFPQYLSDGKVIALKSGLGDIQQYVLTGPGNKEKTIFVPGYFNPRMLSASHNKIVWAEYGFDKRWSNRIYSNLIVFNADKRINQRIKLTRKKHLFAPAFSKDGSMIAAVESKGNGRYCISVFETKSGRLLKEIFHPENDYPIMPAWDSEGSKLYTIMLDDDGKRIDEISISKAEFKTIFRSGYMDISQPVASSDHVFFRSVYSGIDNIYAFRFKDSSVYQVTSVKYGAFDPCLNRSQDTLLFSSYTANGYQISRIPLDTANWISLSDIKDQSVKLYPELAKQELGIPLPVLNKDTVAEGLTIKRYRKGTHLFYLHSWAPLYINANTYEVNSGITVFSQNKLSTAISKLAYLYNYSDRTGTTEGSFTYKGWFPVLSIAASRGQRLGLDTTGNDAVFKFKEDKLTLSASVPLNLTRGKYGQGITSSVYNYTSSFVRNDETPSYFKTGVRNIFEYDIRGFRYLKMAPRDLLPKWGQTFRLNYRQSPFGKFDYGNSFVGQAALLFPGILKHHSLRLDFGGQINENGSYIFSNYLLYPRGYFSQVNQRFSRIIAEYRLPLCYPDWKVGPILYLKRIKGLLFYDYGDGRNKGSSRYYNSTGIELTGDMHLFNFVAPIELGARGIYFPHDQYFRIEFLFNIIFSAL